MAEEYRDNPSVLIADVDCTGEGSRICHQHNIHGYPTVKYFTSKTGKNGEEFKGDRDFAALDKIVKDKLLPKCIVKTGENCSDPELAYIQKMSSKDTDTQKAELVRLKGMTEQTLGFRGLRGSGPHTKAWLQRRIELLEVLAGTSTEL